MSAPITNPIATIAAAGSLSNGCYVGHGKLVSLIMPASWDAAVLTFQGSADGVTYYDIYDYQGAEVVVQADTSRMITIDEFEGAPWIKLRSGTTGAPVAQTVAAAITLVIQKLADMGVK